MASAKEELAAKRKLIAAGREDLAVQQQKLDSMIAQLGTMRKAGDKFKQMQNDAEALRNKITQTSTELNQMARDAGDISEGIGQAEGKLDGFSSKVQNITDKIPMIGSSLSAGIQKATDVAKNLMDKWLKKTDGSMRKGFKILGGILGGLLLGGVIAAFTFFIKLLGKAKENMMEFSTAMTETARSLQMSKSDVKAIGKGVGDWVRYGQGWAGAVAQIREDMGYIPELTAKENSLVAKLATNAGLSGAEISSMYRTSQRLGVTLDTYVKDQAKKIKNLNAEMGLHTTQAEIVKEIAGATDETLAMFGKQNAELEKQVLIGKKIGLNLNQQASIAKSLLDIESSIEAEMEARVLTGKELNFDKARELALNGDISGASAEILEQVGGIDEFNKMNIIQKESLAKAAGLEVGQLQKSLEMQAGIADQANVGGAGGGGGGLDAAAGNTDMQAADDARSRRWGKIFQPFAEAVRKIKKVIEEKLLVFFETGKGKDFVDGINNFATGIASWIAGEGEPGWYTELRDSYITPVVDAISNLWTWASNNPIKAALAGTALAVGTKKLWDGAKSLFGFGKMGTASNPMYVTIGAGGVMNSISDFLKGGKKGGWRRNLLASFKKMKKTVLSKTGITGAKQSLKKKAKGSWLSRGWNKLKSGVKSVASKVKSGVSGAASWAGGKLKQGWQGVKRVGGKVLSAINPIPKLKKSFTGGAGKYIKKALKGVGKIGGKAVKGGLVGALFNAAQLAAIINSDASPMDKAKGIIQTGSGILGGALGSIAGSIVPVVGTLGGGIIGGFLGDWIGSIPAVQNALAPPLAKLFKGEEVQDFILSDRGLLKFQKDDLVIGGTKLNEGLGMGDNKQLDNLVILMEKLIKVCAEDRVMSVDGKELATALAETKNYKGVS